MNAIDGFITISKGIIYIFVCNQILQGVKITKPCEI